MKTAQIIYINQIFIAEGEDFLRSPVLRLIEYVYSKHPHEARFILRQPIWLNFEPSVYEQALIKTAAKRFRVGESSAVGSDFAVVKVPPLDLPDVNSQDKESEVFSSRAQTTLWFQKQAENTGVIAAYFSAIHELKGFASNTNSQIKTRHAEMNLVAQLKIQPKDGDYVIVSLQSCRMCAAGLAEWISGQDVTVYYLEPEANLKNVKTALYGREEQLPQ